MHARPRSVVVTDTCRAIASSSAHAAREPVQRPRPYGSVRPGVGPERQQVAEAMHDLGRFAEHLPIEPEVEGASRPPDVLARERRRASRRSLIEKEVRLEVAEHLELGVEAGLDRPLAQQAGAERVDRLDPRAVQRSQARARAARRGSGSVFGRHRCSSPSRTRAESSAAAASVKVIATSCPRSRRRSRGSRRFARRARSSCPVPAPASTQQVLAEVGADLLARRLRRSVLGVTLTRPPSSLGTSSITGSSALRSICHVPSGWADAVEVAPVRRREVRGGAIWNWPCFDPGDDPASTCSRSS